jgi:hypothetical protein
MPSTTLQGIVTNEVWLLMQQRDLDHPDVQELKRLWWSTYNVARIYHPFDLLPSTLTLMGEIEALIRLMYDTLRVKVSA